MNHVTNLIRKAPHCLSISLIKHRLTRNGVCVPFQGYLLNLHGICAKKAVAYTNCDAETVSDKQTKDIHKSGRHVTTRYKKKGTMS